MLFLLIVENEAEFEDAIRAAFPEDHIKIGYGQWFLSTNDSSTARDVWNRLEGTGTPSGVIVSFVGYYGRANSSVWEWIAAKRNAQI